MIVMNAFEEAAADKASRCAPKPNKPAKEEKVLTVPKLCEFLAAGPRTSKDVATHFSVPSPQASAMLSHLLSTGRATVARVWDEQAERKITQYRGTEGRPQ